MHCILVDNLWEVENIMELVKNEMVLVTLVLHLG